MEGLLPAITSAFQLVLEHLCRMLLVVSESLRHVPGLPAFPWGILVGTLVVESVIVKRRHTSRSVKAPGKRCSVGDEVCAKCSKTIGPMTDADITKSPGVEARSLLLQTLCLRALNKHLSNLSLQDMVGSLKTARKSQPPKLSQATDEKPTAKALGIEGERLQEDIVDDLNKNAHFPESPELLPEEMMGWRQKIQEQVEMKQRLEQLKAQDRVRPSLSVAGGPLKSIPKPDDLDDHMDDGNLESPQKREAESEGGFLHESGVDLKDVPLDADADVSQKNQEITRQLWEQKRMNEVLAAEIRSLQTEKVSLQHENSNLKDEIQQLKLKLRILPETHEDHVTRLQKQLIEAEVHCLDLEKKFPTVWRDMNSTYQFLNTYKKMARDLNQELRRSTCYYQNEIRCQQRRAEEAWVAAEVTERKFQDLRRENDRNRQMLAKVKSKFQPFPGGPFAPAAPLAAHRGPAVPGRPLSHRTPRKEEGPAVRAQESRVTCRCDSASTAAGS
ncbi:Cutaneous T-cell lymphoma-associated antigen 5 [Myotis brandtii]|uniref:Cutaneous T-cell lymphoma-associated antigen 5 n=1 Tax=Myotis brandtii TaxID=109478 RepID=S7Q9A3_MYOBR|nr:Cutaneous T-cell lymphoma-associated antigen 5 [Myotis brandtii]